MQGKHSFKINKKSSQTKADRKETRTGKGKELIKKHINREKNTCVSQIEDKDPQIVKE